MSEDSVVKEVREARDAFAKECKYDPHIILARLREDETKHGERLVTPDAFQKKYPTRNIA